MNLRSRPQSTSFYESFSDLIFGTMAIFVLLMLLFIIQVSESSQSDAAVDELKERIAALSRQVIQQERSMAQAALASARSKKKIEDLEGAIKLKSIELVIAVDSSGSMGDEITRVQNTLEIMAVLLPSLVPDFQVGIVAYCRTSTAPYDEFPLASLDPLKATNDPTFQQFEKFRKNLKPKGGWAPVAEATRHALSMFSRPDPTGTGIQQIFVLIGDVGPFEPNGNEPPYYYLTDAERTSVETQLYREIQAWSNASDQRRVVSIFTAKEVHENDGMDREQKKEAKIKYDLSKPFFENVAIAGGRPEFFTQDIGVMNELILLALVPDLDSNGNR
jgi:Mg-chelatase subunit ChlD